MSFDRYEICTLSTKLTTQIRYMPPTTPQITEGARMVLRHLVQTRQDNNDCGKLETPPKAMSQVDTVCGNPSWYVNIKNVLSPHARTKLAFGHQPRRRALCTRLRCQNAFQPATTASAAFYCSTMSSANEFSFLPSTTPELYVDVIFQ